MFSNNKHALVAVLVIASFAIGGVLGGAGVFSGSSSSDESFNSQSAAAVKALESIQKDSTKALRAAKAVEKSSESKQASKQTARTTRDTSNEGNVNESNDYGTVINEPSSAQVLECAPEHSYAHCVNACTFGLEGEYNPDDNTCTVADAMVAPVGGDDLPDSDADVTYCFSISSCELLQEVCEGTGNTFSDPEDDFGGCFSASAAVGADMDVQLPESGIDFTSQEGKKLAQTILNLEGMYNSTIDGKFGTGSQAALRTWQIAQNLAPTGILDSVTMKAMNSYVLKRLAYFAKIVSDDVLPMPIVGRQQFTCKQTSWPRATVSGSLPNPPQWPEGDFDIQGPGGKVIAECSIGARVSSDDARS